MIQLSCTRVKATLAQIPGSLKQGCVKVSQAVGRVLKNALAAVAHFFARFKAPRQTPSRPLPPTSHIPTPPPSRKPPGAQSAPGSSSSAATIAPALVCNICREDEDQTQAMNSRNAEFLQCAHRFHIACLNNWLNSNPPASNVCPTCRMVDPRIKG